MVALHCLSTAFPCGCTSLPISAFLCGSTLLPFCVFPLYCLSLWFHFTAFPCGSTAFQVLIGKPEVELPKLFLAAARRGRDSGGGVCDPGLVLGHAAVGLEERSVERAVAAAVPFSLPILVVPLPSSAPFTAVPCVASAFPCGTTAFQCLPFPPVPSIPSSAFQRAFQRAFQCALQYSLWCQCLAVLSVPFLAMPLPSRCVRLGARSSSCAGAAAHCIMWMTCCSAAEGRLGARRQRTKTTTRTKMKTSRIWTCRRRMPRRQWQWRRLR